MDSTYPAKTTLKAERELPLSTTSNG